MKQIKISSSWLNCFYVATLVLLYISESISQSYSITGKITDTLNNPIQYVNVALIGTNLGDASDENGLYEISNLTPGTYEIKFSAIGYIAFNLKTLVIEDSSLQINVTLKEEILESEAVVVTSGKYEQKKSELPVSSELIDGDNFLERNFSDMEDALRYVPGINMVDDQISIRGSSGYSRGTGSRVLLALDGLPFYTGDTGETIWEAIPTTEIKRVEIIKGAASSLYGSSAIGGVINALSRDISPYPITTINGFAGVYDRPYYPEWDWSDELRPFNGLTLSHSNTFGKFGFNLSLSRLESSSYKENDNSKKFVGFLKMLYAFTPTSSLTFISNTLNKRAESFIYWKDSRNALIPPDNTLGEKVETNRYLFGLVFRSVIGTKIFYNINTSYYLNDWEDNYTPMNESTSDLIRGEIQFNFSLTSNMILVTGVESYASKVKSTIFGNPNSYTYGAYALLDIDFEFPLIVSIGIRYDYSKLDSLAGSSALSPKLGLNYKLSDRIILRSSLGTGFRAPTLAETFTNTSASGIRIKPNPNLQSETNLTFEIGVNYEVINQWNFDVAAFQNEYYDMIEPSVDPTDNEVRFDNVVRARIQGFEISTVIQFVPKEMFLTIGYTYLWARDVENNIALKYRPRNTVYSGFEIMKWNFNLGIDFRYWSRIEEIDDELVDLGIIRDGELRTSVFTTDFRLAYNFREIGWPVDIYLNIKNLTNYNFIELIGNLRPVRNYSLGFNWVIE
ncbi:MAG: TonB-dependent receptor [Ignavibacteria bacterium]|nr:TonB-dependent receptor [Ignavibacteria bacterium]